MTDYTNMTREQLVELLNLRDDKIKQLENEILELKRGYIYIVQFENDIEQNIFKCGKTRNGQLENRFGVYRTNDSPKHGDMKVIRVAAVNDCLAAEQFMHESIRKMCKCADNHSNKSIYKNEWYIDDEMLNIEAAFEETIEKYGMDDDKFVEKYDSIAKDELQEHLIEIDHYKNIQLKPKTYYIHESTHAIYAKTKYGLDIKTPTKRNLYSFRKDTEKSGTSQVKLDYLINEYCK